MLFRSEDHWKVYSSYLLTEKINMMKSGKAESIIRVTPHIRIKTVIIGFMEDLTISFRPADSE